MSLFTGDDSNTTQLWAQLGVWISPGLGQAYPDLKAHLDSLHADRVSVLSFVPAGWLDVVRGIQANHPNDLVRIAPSQLPGERLNPNAAPWTVSTPDISTAWQAVYNAENDAVAAYARQQQADGKAELDALYANAEFWNKAYTLAQSVLDAPGNAINAIFDKISFPVKIAAGAILLLGILYYGRKLFR